MRPPKKILCVDCDEQALSVRKFLLETRGYRVVAVTTGKAALEVLGQMVPGTIDLILCDLLMPQMDGNELVRRAKQLHPGLPALIISETIEHFDRDLYADAFLPKGLCEPTDLLQRVRIMVARKRGPKKKVVQLEQQRKRVA